MRPSYKTGMVLNYVIHLGILALFFFAIPSEHRDGWYLYHGGDQVEYYELAESLVDGAPVESRRSLGFSLIIAVPAALLRPEGWRDLLPLFVVLHAVVLHGLSQLLLGEMAYRFTKSRCAAWGAVLLWVLFPLVYYVGFTLLHSQALAAHRAARHTWAQMLSDPPAAFLTLLIVWVFFYGFDRQQMAPVGAAGLLSGFVGMVRLSGLLVPFLLGLLLLRRRRWRAAALFAASAALAFTPQLAYNAQMFGSPLTTGYQLFLEPPPYGLPLFHPLYVAGGFFTLWTRQPAIAAAGIAAAALGVPGVVWLWRRDRIGVYVLAGWVLSNVLFYGMYYLSWFGGMDRLLISAYPAMAVIAAASIAWAHERLVHTGRSEPVCI